MAQNAENTSNSSSLNNSSSNNSNLPLTQNPASVYFIHPSKNPKRGIVIALACKNKLSFIDGSLAKPSENDPAYAAWERCNVMVTSYILHSLDTTIARSVIYFTSAREIWRDIEKRYSLTFGAQLFSVQQTLHELSQGSITAIAEFFTEIKALWDQLNGIKHIPVCTCTGCTCNITQQILQQQQEERLIQLLMKVDTKYPNVRTNILMMQPLPNVSMVYILLVQEEKKRSIVSPGDNHAMAFVSEDRKFESKVVVYKPPHSSSWNRNQNSNRGGYNGYNGVRRNLYCEHCKMSGHTIDRCYKIHGHPSAFKNGKGKRIAAIVYGDDDEDEGGTTTEPAQLTAEQYHKLVQLVQDPNC
ncbi:uncharacterized protein LOC104883096 [Beta vulgaris subsp. vulgaris]|uniref:uncharacterized protein LOC104883096 n=1 Tax=Beta vulgaris subsp. vulgaris TaxID=3555 RepID=UPI00203734BB|nr:uncharacterized protein LOC104883096 [Beta vulgaris subsp. vulgaris]